MEQTLGKRIMAARKKLGLTQDQLAERLGVTAQAVSKWENDQSCPDITMLPKLAELFNTTTDELLGREAPPTVHEAEIVKEAPNTDGGGREILWDTGRRSALGFAALVLLTGGLTLANALLDWGASFWDILWPSALLVFGLGALISKFSFFRMGCALLGGYFLLENLRILNMELGDDLIFPIILLIFGVSLLFDALRKPKSNFSIAQKNNSNASRNNYQADGEGFTFSASFGEQNQLISMSRLARGDISTSFGEYKLDFSGVDAVEEGCSVEASCSFGELTLLIPKRFRVQCDSSTSFAAVQTHGQPDTAPTGTILLRASAGFGEIKVRYI